MNIETLTKIGGREWIKDDMRRVYFNVDLAAELIGLSVTRYNTGNISAAKLNGEKISNSKARKILGELEFGKVWYDVNSGEFHTRGMPNWGAAVIEAIKARVAETEAS